MTLQFTIPGKPQGKGRPRYARGHFYTPSETKAYEQQVAWSAKAAGAQARRNPVALDVRAVFSCPESWGAKKKQNALEIGYCMAKPDSDNILKIVMDGLNGVAWEDDKQVVYASIDKYYGDSDRVEVDVNYF